MSRLVEMKHQEKLGSTNDDDLCRLSRVFHDNCSKKTGLLHREDLKVAIIILFGYKPSEFELNELFHGVEKRYGQNQEGMPLEQFIDVMSIKLQTSDIDEEIRQTFLAFDYHCRGFIMMDDLRKAASYIAPHLSVHSLETAFREVDRDGDGRVSFKDFEFMMKYNKE